MSVPSVVVVVEASSHRDTDRTRSQRVQAAAGARSARSSGSCAAEVPVEQYARRVSMYAEQTISTGLFHGEDYENLGSYIMRPFATRDTLPATNDVAIALLDRPVLLYSLEHGNAAVSTTLSCVGDLKRECKPESRRVRGCTILFLSGHQTPELLGAVGACYCLDPAFFHRHMQYIASFGRQRLFSLPSLPSATEGVVKLRYLSIGVRGSLSPSEVAQLRSSGSKDMDAYTHDLNIERGLKQGDSIVRKYWLHSRYFSVEQQITIGIQQLDGSWSGVVWIDSGHDLDQGPQGPWHKQQSKATNYKPAFLPTMLHMPKIALKWRKYCEGGGLQHASPLTQTASKLGQFYGRTLDPNVMSVDAFYAISELMQFTAFSICQVLNLVEDTIANETDQERMQAKNYDVSELSYHQQMLEGITRDLRDDIRTIQLRGGPDWPRAHQKEHREKVDRKAEALLSDYEELHHWSQALSDRCRSDMAMIINQASISESQRAFRQAKKVEQLTRLASMFLPISFAATLLGMNLKLFGQGTLPWWSWFVISAPLVLATFCVMKYM